MNDYKQQMDSLPFDPDFQEKALRAVRANAPQKTASRFGGKIWKAAVIAAALALLTTVTAVAVNLLKSPDQVADSLNGMTDNEKGHEVYGAIARAFRSEDARIINREQEVGDYIVTLQGTVNLKGVSFGSMNKGISQDAVRAIEKAVRENRNFIVVAFRRRDGQPICFEANGRYDNYERDEAIFLGYVVTPFVQGFDPTEYDPEHNEIYSTTVHYLLEEDTVYELIEAPDLERYADRTVYLTVALYEYTKGGRTPMSIFQKDQTIFSMDEKGAFRLNERAEGIPAAIFELYPGTE